MTKRLISIVACLVFAVLSETSPLRADWPENGVAVTTDSLGQALPQITADGVGGAIITWIHIDTVNTYGDIYAQRIDTHGNLLWESGAIPVCLANMTASKPQIISDGSAGAIITWKDFRDEYRSDVYAQRIDSSGSVLWTEDGVCIGRSQSSGYDYSPQLIPDSEGGAIIIWEGDAGGTAGWDILAQRIDADGDTLWAAGGIAVCAAIYSQHHPRLASDGTGGAIVTWVDYRSGTASERDIYAQRIDPSGNPLWPVDGIPVCTAEGAQDSPALTTDGAGGAIIVWQDDRDAYDLYAQMISASGDTLWDKDGVRLCILGGTQRYPLIVSDTEGGAIIVWETTLGPNILAQRIDSDGNVLWPIEGFPITWMSCSQRYHQVVPDGCGGAIITWDDQRSPITDDHDIYAQRVSGDGHIYCAENGIPVCTAANAQGSPAIAAIGDGCAIITWNDGRDGASHIYANRICRCAVNPVDMIPTAELVLHQNHPNPFNPVTTIRYFLPAAAHVTLDIYDVAGRRIARLVDDVQKGGGHTIEWRGLNDNGNPVSSGTYIYRVRAGKEELSRKMILLR